MTMSRLFVTLITLFFSTVLSAQPALTSAGLTALDRVTLEASLRGNVEELEPYLAPRFQASIQMPTERGRHQTMVFTRQEFLLYAWQARATAQNYRARAKPGSYVIAPDGGSATVTRIIDESLVWNGQPLRYTSERTTTYRPFNGRTLITHLEVRILNWSQTAADK